MTDTIVYAEKTRRQKCLTNAADVNYLKVQIKNAERDGVPALLPAPPPVALKVRQVFLKAKYAADAGFFKVLIRNAGQDGALALLPALPAVVSLQFRASINTLVCRGIKCIVAH